MTKIKNKKTIIIIALAIVVIFSAGFVYMKLNANDFVVGGDPDNPGISIHNVYDEFRNPISSDTGALATVSGVNGVKYITLRINALNKDTIPLNFKVIDASPQSFKDSLQLTDVKSANTNTLSTWITSLIDIQGMEGTTQTFTVKIEASSSARTASSKEFTFDLRIDNDPTSVFDIEILQDTGEPIVFGNTTECTLDEHCGTGRVCENNVCVDEEDVPPSSSFVKFRTTDLIYSSGAVAYAYNGCGVALKKYGRTSGACLDYKCNDPTNAVMTNAPTSTGTTYVWAYDANTLRVCDSVSVGTVAYPKRYTTSDSDAGQVSDSVSSVDSTKEATC